MITTESARLTPDAWVGSRLGPSGNHLEERFLVVDSAAVILGLEDWCDDTHPAENECLVSVWLFVILVLVVLVCHGTSLNNPSTAISESY